MECYKCSCAIQGNPSFNNGPTCCENFDHVLNFASQFIAGVDEAGATQRFSVLVFSDEATILSSLTDAASASASLVNTTFVGGWTNTGDAIRFCYETLKDSENERVIVVVADGTSTIGDDAIPEGEDNDRHHAYAVGQSHNVQDAHISVLPIVIPSESINITLMEEIASGDIVVLDDMESMTANASIESLLTSVRCDTDNKTFVEGAWELVYDESFENGTLTSWTF